MLQKHTTCSKWLNHQLIRFHLQNCAPWYWKENIRGRLRPLQLTSFFILETIELDFVSDVRDPLMRSSPSCACFFRFTVLGSMGKTGIDCQWPNGINSKENRHIHLLKLLHPVRPVPFISSSSLSNTTSDVFCKAMLNRSKWLGQATESSTKYLPNVYSREERTCFFLLSSDALECVGPWISAVSTMFKRV